MAAMLTGEEIVDNLRSSSARELEGQHLEFKRWIPDERELSRLLREVAVCFANAEGGQLVLGVDEDRSGVEAISGCRDYDLDAIRRMIFDGTKPAIIAEVLEHPAPQGTILLINVHPSPGIHTTADGTMKRRVGRDCMPITGEQVLQFEAEKGIVDYTSRRVASASEDDLDPLEVGRLKTLLSAKKPGSELLQMKDTDLLVSLGILARENGRTSPTVAGLLLVGKENAIKRHIPSHEIVYLRMSSETEYEKREDMRKPLLSCLDRLVDLIELHNKVFTLRHGLLHIEIPDFDLDVVREAVLNAVIHRDYLDDNAVYIRHSQQGMEVSNPGGFFGGVTENNLLHHAPRHRNRHLAEIFQKLGLVERAGLGVTRIFNRLLSQGKEPPVYRSDSRTVGLSFAGGLVDERFAAYVAERQKTGYGLSLDELLVLSFLRKKREIDVAAAAALAQRDEGSVRGILNEMVDKGLLERGGSGRSTAYRLARAVYDRVISKEGYVRDRGVDRSRHSEMVLDYVREFGWIDNTKCRGLCGLSRPQAYRLLNKLAREGRLVMIGRCRGGRYVLPNATGAN